MSILICVVYLTNFNAGILASDIKSQSRIITVEEGSQVFLFCPRQTNSTLAIWEFRPHGTRSDFIIYDSKEKELNSEVTSAVAILDVKEGFVDLFFSSVQLSEAGIYTSRVIAHEANATKFISRRAELSVVKVGTRCKADTIDVDINGLGKAVQIECSIGFKGNAIPKMAWQNNATKEWVSSKEQISNGSESTKILTSIAKALLTEDGPCLSYTFIAFFNVSVPDKDNSIQTNASDYKYEYKWTSSSFNSADCKETIEGSDKSEERLGTQKRLILIVSTSIPLAFVVLLLIMIIFFFGKNGFRCITSSTQMKSHQNPSEAPEIPEIRATPSFILYECIQSPSVDQLHIYSDLQTSLGGLEPHNNGEQTEPDSSFSRPKDTAV